MTELPIILSNFIPMASRIYHQLHLEQYVMNAFAIAPAHHDVFAYPPVALVNLKTIVIERCNTNAGDSFLPLFAEFIYRWFLPMGASSMKYRSVHTETRKTTAVQLMEYELGMDVSQALYVLVNNTPLADIINHPEHELHQLLILYTFHHLMEQMCGVHFFDEFMIMSSELSMKHEQLRATHEYHARRRPRVVFIQQQVYVHDQLRWYKCVDMVDALLKFITMMRKVCQIGDDIGDVKEDNITTNTSTPIYHCKAAKNSKSIDALCERILGSRLYVDLLPWRMPAM